MAIYEITQKIRRIQRQLHRKVALLKYHRSKADTRMKIVQIKKLKSIIIIQDKKIQLKPFLQLVDFVTMHRTQKQA